MSSNTQGNGNDGLRVNFEGSPIVTIASDSIQTSEKMTIDGVDLKSLAKLAVADANSLPTLPSTERPPGSLVILLDSRTILRVDTTGSVWENAEKRGDSILASLDLVSEATGSGGGNIPNDGNYGQKTIIDFTTFKLAGNATNTSSSDPDLRAVGETPPKKDELELEIAGSSTRAADPDRRAVGETPAKKDELELELELEIAGSSTRAADPVLNIGGGGIMHDIELELEVAGNNTKHDDDNHHHHHHHYPTGVPVEIALLLEELRTTQERIIRRDVDSVRNTGIGVVVNSLYYETLRLNQNQTFYGILQTHATASTIPLGGDVVNVYNPVHIDGSPSNYVVGYESGTYPFTMNIFKNLVVDVDAVTMASGFVLATTPAQEATTRTRDFLASITISIEVVEGEGTPPTDFDFALRTRACSFTNSLNTHPEQLDGGLNPVTNTNVENVWYAQLGEGRMTYDPTNGFDSSVGGSYSLATTLVLPKGSMDTVITIESACSAIGAKIRIGNITLKII